MTCRRNVMHPLDALYQAACKYPGGIGALAARFNLTEDTYRKKLRHQVESHHLTYDHELSELLFCLDEAGVPGWADTLHALCWRHGHLALPVPQVDGGDVDGMTAAVVASVREHADAIEAIGEALHGDKKIDAVEMANIDLQIEEAVQALMALKDLARRRHEADFPHGSGRGGK